MSLPGKTYALDTAEDYLCEHCEEEGLEVQATHRVQGETDSFGCEWIYVCDKHRIELRDQKTVDMCHRCHVETEVIPTRDWEEGSHGPVYWVCAGCLPFYTQETV